MKQPNYLLPNTLIESMGTTCQLKFGAEVDEVFVDMLVRNRLFNLNPKPDKDLGYLMIHSLTNCS